MIFQQLLFAIQNQKPVVLMMEGPEGSLIQRKVKPTGVTPEQYLIARCITSSQEFTVSLPEVIGLRYWLDVEE
ncbi:MAG: hypothetical protein M0Z31_13365 [Clostridia bacterium]|nr:hypothetical protein [Clostridia bacterium]